MSTENLFKPLKVGRITLDHRIAMAPLTRMRAIGHQVNDDLHPLYYAQRASAPGTLLISEATYVSEASSGYPDAPGIYKKEHIEGWRKVADAIHEKKSFLFVQLWALGRAANKADIESRGLPYVSSSNVADDGINAEKPVPRALTVAEIKEYVASFAQAAKNSIEAGADGVEIHGANGYLIDQFLHENTNTRTDQYGGSIENRARFALEIVDAVSEAIGADRVGIRLSPWGIFGGMDAGVSPIPQFSYLAAELERRSLAGNEIAYIHLVEPRWAFNKTATDVVFIEGSNQFIRDVWKGVIVRAGGFELENSKTETAADDKLLIAVGRHFISTPDLVSRWKNSVELNAYDRNTFYSSGKEGYIDYPFAEELKAKA